MATRSHSRFTDEVYCTAAPSTAQIESRKKDVLSSEIFLTEDAKQFEAGLIAAEELDSKQLYETYPPQFKDENKRFIFELLNKDESYVPSNSPLLITRWKPFVPYIESNDKNPTKVEYLTDVFGYEATSSNNQTVEWYLNFANSDIFAYYGGHLLAQDELQVLECVELAALREYLVQAVNTVGSRTTGSDAHNGKSVPTPILISNAERVIALDTTTIYGNAFSKAKHTELESAFKKVGHQTANIIAIEAPSYGEGQYTADDIRFIVTTAYTGFKAAQILANKTYMLNANTKSESNQENTNTPRTKVHTGWWGCGAYGNNRQLMLVAQILAANWAQINEIVFHVQNNEHQEDINQAKKIVEELLTEKDVDQVIEKLVQKNFNWEKSNNT